MLPALRELLLEHVTELRVHPDQPVFPTRTGRRNTTDTCAASSWTIAGAPPVPGSQRSGVRRSARARRIRSGARSPPCSEVGLPPRRAMYLLGHTDPKLTMGVYQQVVDMTGEAPARLEQILGCDLDDAFTVLAGRAARRSGTSPEWRPHTEPAADRDPLDSS